MYSLSITNNFGQTVVAHPGDHKIDQGDQKTLDKLGNTYIEIPGLWNICFMDLGDNMIPGYPLTETWGVLVRGANVEAYYRYEGGGNLTASIDEFGRTKHHRNRNSFKPLILKNKSLWNHLLDK